MADILVQADTAAFDEWMAAVSAGRSVSKLQHNTAVVQFAAALDLVINPFEVLTREGGEGGTYRPLYPSTTATPPGGTAPVPAAFLGQHGTVQGLRVFSRLEGDARFQEQKRYVGALAFACRNLSRYSAPPAPGRNGAALILAIPAGYYVIAGIAALAAIAIAATVTAIQEHSETQRTAVAIAGAGQDYAGRLVAYRQTGTMPPPSARETAAAAVIQSSSQTFWTELGRGLGEGAKTGSKWLMGGAALALVVLASSQGKGASRES